MADDVKIGGEKLNGSGNDAHLGRGVYANHPAQTPKYHTGNNVDSMMHQARFYIDLPDLEAFERYKARVPDRARHLVDVLSPQSKIGGVGYFDFLLTSVAESYQEKFQVSEVLSDGFIAYFFGQKAPMWSLSGMLINSKEDQWYDAFHILYQDVLRGTQLARQRVPLKLAYDNRVLIGSLVSMSTNLNGGNETAVSFQTQFLVKRVIIRNPDQINTTDVSGAITAGQGGKAAQQTHLEMFASLDDARRANPENNAAVTSLRAGFNAQELQSRMNAGISSGSDTGGQSRLASTDGDGDQLSLGGQSLQVETFIPSSSTGDVTDLSLDTPASLDHTPVPK